MYLPSVRASKTRAQNILDDFFNPNVKSGIRSIHEAYIEITGDRKVSGRIQDCDRGRFREAIGTDTFANIFGNAIQGAMVVEYRRPDYYSAWKKVAYTGRVDDFRSQTRYRIGGYGDLLSIVNEGDDYQVVNTPSDESVSYAVTKRGGLETITLEAIKNDNSDAVRRIPKKLAEAANRTLCKFVLSFLRDNPVIYDGVELFHASHGNLGNAALSAVSVTAARTAMRKQKELDSDDPLGISLRSLLVPFDLEETGVNLFRRDQNQDRTFLQSQNIEVVPVWYWTDADDWCAAADPAEVPSIEVGFLDGHQEPELFLDESPSSGSLFARDMLAYKIRHIYGGAVLDYRGLYKSVVA